MKEKSPIKVINLFNFIGQKWTLMILFSIGKGANTFSQVKKDLGTINTKILSERLSELQDEGFIKREIVQEKPVKIRYSLTKKGESFGKQVENLEKWAADWKEEGTK